MKHILIKSKDSDPLEERVKVIEEKLNILVEQVNDFMTKYATTLNLSEKSKLPIGSMSEEYDYDDWYTNHGQGD